ncbi:hypothetical protein PENSPDRAFT_688538 [Peniophora sp. CONT]|nr:hypothetical protein PENSPDRAFT_688538 [Peniophora sp. CONT]
MFASLFTLAALAASAVAQITINTPSGATGAIQCEVYQVSWTGGTGPFDIRLLDAGQNFIEEVAASATTSPVQWTVNQAAGTILLFSIHDSTGTAATTGQFTVQASSNTGCLGASASGSSTAAGSSAASSATSAAGGSATATATGSVSSSVSSIPSSAASAASSAVSSAASAASSAASSATRPVSSIASAASSAAASISSAASSATQSSAASVVAPAGVLGAVVAGLFALAA